jgi:5'-deoxynucleotidase YfbR-like HD superfamily hydrolase
MSIVLEDRVESAKAWFAGLTPEQQEAEMRAHRDRWVRGEADLDRRKPIADDLTSRGYRIETATLTGLVDLLDPKPETITLAAIAHGLGKLDRWAGALEVPFFVAQHSLLVDEIFLRIAPALSAWSLYALKHDAHEYLLGDIITPAAKLFAAYDHGFARRLDGLKARLDRAIEARFGLPPAPMPVHAAIAEADAIAAHIEWKAFMPAANGPSPFAPTRKFPNLRPKPLCWADAADLFRVTFERELAAAAWEK